jgi:hypothetical protein
MRTPETILAVALLLPVFCEVYLFVFSRLARWAKGSEGIIPLLAGIFYFLGGTILNVATPVAVVILCGAALMMADSAMSMAYGIAALVVSGLILVLSHKLLHPIYNSMDVEATLPNRVKAASHGSGSEKHFNRFFSKAV